MESTLRRTWAEIDLDALAHNYRTLRDRVGPEVKFLGVVKADAYGHGAVQVSRTLQTLGADYLAVSSIDEATELRCNGITMPILILGHTPREQVGRLIDLHITQAVSCQAKALEYSEEAVRCGGELTVHIKVDTGMSRLGYLVSGRHFDTGTADICAACALPGLRAEGIFTHFAVSDEPDADSRDYTEKQLALFRRVIDAVEAKRGQRFVIRHCANSGGVASYPETYMDMVRPGILLYGCGDLAEKLGLHPVMALKTTVSTIKTYEPGTDVSYGRRFTTERVTRMGVVPDGYADGFHRCLSDRCSLVTGEGVAPQRGRICMDMSMIDLTDLPGVQVGDEVEVFGKRQRVDVFSALTQGAGEGLSVVIRILPALAALLTAVYMLRASGAMDALAAVLSPVLGALGIPPETAALLLVRPVSGSGALAVGSQLMEQYGPDSAVGRTAAVMLGCSETTFYTVAVYFGAAGIRRTRYTIPAALTADLAAFIAAAWAVRLCFGGE